MRLRRAVLLTLILFFLFLAVSSWAVLTVRSQSRNLEVVFLDVGQGDAIYVESPGGTQLLVDGGRGGAVLRELSNVMPFWDRSLDLVVATHPDADHIGGLVDVLERFQVEAVLDTSVESDTPAFRAYSRKLKQEKAREVEPQRGTRITLDGNTVITVLSGGGTAMSESNKSSIVLRVDYGETSFLLTGDATRGVERELLSLHNSLDIDVLKVGHHGSSTSTSKEFVSATSPEYAVISVGEDNSYGHPTSEVLEVLEQQGVEILRTDLDGSIRFTSDGRLIHERGVGVLAKLFGI